MVHDYDDESDDESKVTVRAVQLDGLVLLKMIKHCTQNVPEVVTGQLLGLDVGEKLEVTNSFPFPTDMANDDDNEDYQLEMMKNLRAVNIDNNTVGWYQSALLGSWINSSVIDTQHSYQKEIPNSVVVVYDPFKTTRGHLALKAFRLTNEFMELYTGGDTSAGGFAKYSCDSTNIFEEIPIKVHNSHLVHGFLYELREGGTMNCEADRLHLSADSFLQKTLNTLSTTVDEYEREQSKYHYQQRLLARTKRAAEEAANADPDVPAKVQQQPSRLESMLLINQLSNYCDQIQIATKMSFNKLYVAEALSKEALVTEGDRFVTEEQWNAQV